jgi:hypothetical protein
MRRALPLLVLAAVLAAAPARAHVGSPNIFYDGDVGPYPVRVMVRPPAVIPGLAEITVRILDGRKVDQVTVQPIHFKTGLKGAPPADVAEPVPGAPGVWSGKLWLMVDGSFSVRVQVRGPAGEGMTQVPVPAVRSGVLAMDKSLTWTLEGLGLFLFLGAVCIIGAAVRESSLPPGETVDKRRIFQARKSIVIATIFFALVIWACRVWSSNVDVEMRQKLFKPSRLQSTVKLEAGQPLLALTIEDTNPAERLPLIPDHGKLMHLFLLREPGLDAFAHLHPVAQNGKDKDFLAALPALPAGTYRVYADVVDESGFPQTLVDQVSIPAAVTAGAQGGVAPDPDDSWRASEPLGRPAVATSRLEDGGSMLWHQEPLVANRETTLRFEVRGADGRPAPLEPYMGMLSHAVINRDDGKVFIHLHPMGTANMAAQEMFTAHESGAAAAGSMAGMPGMPGMANSSAAPGTSAGSVLSFPYEFPQPGHYRLWVQVKSAGRILTGVFDTEVGKG